MTELNYIHFDRFSFDYSPTCPLFKDFSLTIPKRKTLSLDGLKSILSSSQWSDRSTQTFKHVLERIIIDPEYINKLFVHYSEKQIKRMLTRQYRLADWVTVISNPLEKKEDTVYEPANSVEEMLDRFVFQRQMVHPQLFKNLTGKMVDKYQFKVLKNKREYEETSKLFVNCVNI